MRLVAIDMDGTLLHDDCTVSEYTKEMIREAARHDIMVIPTSGRCFRSIKSHLDDVKELRYFNCTNGTSLVDAWEDRSLMNRHMPADIVYDIYKRTKEMGASIELYSELDTYVEKDMIDIALNCKAVHDMYVSLFRTAIPIESMDTLLKTGVMKANKINIMFPDYHLFRKVGAMYKKVPGLIVTYPSMRHMEIFMEGNDKDIGLEILRQKLGVSREDIVAIGDSTNDITMLQYAQVGVAVGNAMTEAKAAADLIVDSNNDDGPAKVLEMMIKGEI